MKKFDQINMIPFIDIMLVLLAIVLTTATFVSQGLIEVDLPSAGQTQTPSSSAEPLEITIDQRGQVYFQDQPVALAVLEDRLGQYRQDTPVKMRVDKNATFEPFIQVVDLLKKHQFSQMSIEAQQR